MVENEDIEVGLIDVDPNDQEIGAFALEVDDDGNQFVGEIEIDESEQPKPQRKFGGGLVEDETFLKQGEPKSFSDKIVPFLKASPLTFGLFNDPKKEKTKATQALIDSEIFKIRPSQAYDFKKSIDRVAASRNSIGKTREELGKKVLAFQNSPEWTTLPGEVAGAAAGVISGTAKFIKGFSEAHKAGKEERKNQPDENLERFHKERLDMMLESGYYSKEEYEEKVKEIPQYIADSTSAGEMSKWIDKNIYEPTAKTAEKILTKVEVSTEGFSRDLLPQYIGTFSENPSWRRAFSSLASGGGSMAMAIPISVLLGPGAGAGVLSMAEAGPVYDFARSKGKSEKEAMDFAMATALATFFLEKYGLEKVLGAKGTKLQRFVTGSVAESSTEISQTIVQNAIKKYGIDDSISIFDEIIESAIGGLVGGPTSVMFGNNPVVSEVQKDQLRDISEEVKNELPLEEQELFVNLSEQEPNALVVGVVEDTEGTIVGYNMADMGTGNTFEVGTNPTIEEIKQGRESVKELNEIDSQIQTMLEMDDESFEAEINRLLGDQELGERTERFRSQILEVVPEKQAEAVVALLGARAKAVGMTSDEYIEYHGLEVKRGVDEGEQEFEQLFQRSPEETFEARKKFLTDITEMYKAKKNPKDTNYPTEAHVRAAQDSVDFLSPMSGKSVMDLTFFQDKDQTSPTGETKANVTFTDTKTIITAFESADVTSLVHELGHVFRRDLDTNDLAIAEEWAGVKNGEWTVKAEEKFARGFEKYLADGKAPNAELQGIFEQFKQWLTEIYRTIKGSSIDIEITPEIQGVFDRLLTESEIAENEGQDTLQQKAESVKTRIRRKTGQARGLEEKIISERDALREVFKRSAMAARKAMSEGNKSGVVKEKIRMKELLTRASERRKKSASIKQIKAKIKRELKFAKAKKVSGKLRGKFTPEIQATLDKLIEVSKLKTAEAESRLLSNIEKYGESIPEEVALENHLLEVVARVDTMVDPERMQEVLDEIKALKDEGRLINNLRAFNRSEEIRGKVETTIEELGGVPDDLQIKGIQEYTAKTISKRAKQALKTFGKTMSTWDWIMDMLSSKSKTEPGKSFISQDNNLNEYKNREKRGTKEALNDLNQRFMDAFGLKTSRQTMNKILKDKAEEIVFKNMPMKDPITGKDMEVDLTFTRSELRKRAMELRDPSLWVSFQQMGYTPQTAIEISEALTAQDKVFIDSALEFWREYYHGNNEVYKRITGVNLPYNPFYSAISREGVSKPVEGVSEFLTEISFRASAQSAGALKARVGSTKHIAKQNDFSVLERHVAEMEHFKAWAERVRDLNAVWKNPNVRAAVEINHGKDILFLVDKHISDIATGSITTGNLLKGLDKFRINFVKASLAGKPSIIPKQLSSFIAFAEKMPVDQFAKNMALFWTDPVKHTKEIYTSDMLQSRGQNIERDLKAAMKSKEHSAFAKHQSFTNMLLLNVKIGDQGAIVLGGWPYYKWMKDQGKTHNEAISELEKFSDLTQQSADITEQSYWQRGGPLAKLFTMFMSSPNLYYQKEIGAVRNMLSGRQGIKQTAKTLVIYHIILPSLFQLMSDRFTWDEDEQKRAMILGALNGVFIIGDALDWMLRKAMDMQEFNMEVPVYSVAHDIIKATALVDAFDLTAEEFFRAMAGVASVVGVSTGLPAKQALTMGKGGYDVLDGEYEKGITELIGYSTYKAEKLAKD